MEKSNHSVISNMGYWLKYYWKNSPIVIGNMVLEILLGPLFGMLALYFPKVTLALVEEQAVAEKVVLVLGIYTLLYIGTKSIQSVSSNYSGNALSIQRQRIAFLLFLKSLRLKYSQVESEEGKLAYNEAIESVYSSGALIGEVVGFISTILNFVLYSTVLSVLNVWMVVMLIGLSFINYWVSLRNLRFWNRYREESAIYERHYSYIKSAMGRVSAAKDIRIFEMSGWLKRRLEETLADRKRLSKRKGIWEWQSDIMSNSISLLRDIAAYAYLIYMAVQGNMAVSDFVLYFSAITGFFGFVRSLAEELGGFRRLSADMDWVRNYLEAPEEDRHSGNRHITELRRPIEIEFRDVSFAYISEGKDKQIFSHLNLKIFSGEKLALVGVNGAGKTTLVKLLCGFYEPDEGVILLNGIDMREFPKAEIYELFSVVFQDIFFPFVKVDESIVLQETEKVDRERLKMALEQAGMAEMLNARGQKAQSVLDNYMGTIRRKDGLELSGGQKQRLLLARALYKDGCICVLDEPTAALDPIAESEVYEAYQKYTEGKTSIFISHRLASTSFSDRIVLLDKGQVLEQGTHQELMAKNGAYAEMFRIQSSYYKEDGEEE